jgi:hypothetical protein
MILNWLKDLMYFTYLEVLELQFWSLLLVFIISFIIIHSHIASYIKKTSDLNDEEKGWEKLSFGFGLFGYLFIALLTWGVIIFDGTADMMMNGVKYHLSETVEAVKSMTLEEIADKTSEGVIEVKEATAEKVGKIIQDTSEEFIELKDSTSAKLQGIFKQKEALVEAE